ncbi:tRNA uridine-5-carboxymethylaminomethyl(34) synthesis GTPase MnmE [Hippea jasoniae]|uniref:tRNA uridine-5-carboxymethylaminomethyl(34) synthesis GTPase MnmE n=1 Tax=Hippea jasoniae TaxID=944479 RepID=UPI0005565987|nr:tRNA uridine-5-carboxymethylaminomethyl(34) synthesis GTPase MnmE [Hippea jasoniae]
MLHDNDIIAAIATAKAEAAIGIIRVSGNNCLELLPKIFTKRPPYQHRKIYYGHIIDSNGEILDEVLVSIFKAPHSYTGEDSFEISCHGGLVVLNSVLERVIEAGARLAQPGEFTKRAFLNGKLDLSQAEAVAKVISSKSKRALFVAQRQLRGNFSDKLDEIREQILFLMAENEVRIDHPEEELSDLEIELKIAILGQIKQRLIDILRASESSHYLFEGVYLTIAGKPNVGKSSLLNAIVGSDRAIVTDIPGTTRDIIKEQFTINGIPFLIIDTAGIRNSKDKVEQIGVKLSFDAINKADLVLAVFDGSQKLEKEDFDLISYLKKIDKETIAVVNKIDLKQQLDIQNIPFKKIVKISTLTKTGLEKLLDELAQFATKGIVDADIVSLTAQQKSNLKNAIITTDKLVDDIKNDIDPALISVDFLELSSYLDEIVGRITNEDMLDVMFKNFCIGK